MSASDEAPGFEGIEGHPGSSEDVAAEPRSPDGLARAHPSVPAVRVRFDDAVLRHEVQAGDEHVLFVDPERVFDVLEWLRDDEEQLYNYLSDLTAVDFGGERPLQVVYQLYSIPYRRALRIKAELPVDALEIESVVPLWKSADWLEREVWDMFGIRFRNHPNLRRILMPEHYEEGHPLRKDFPLRGRFSREEQTRRALAMDADDYYVDSQRGPGREPQLVEWQELGGAPVPVNADRADDDEAPANEDEEAER